MRPFFAVPQNARLRDGVLAVVHPAQRHGTVKRQLVEALLGPEVNFRDHPHATYKLLFNGLYYGSAKPAQLP